MKKGVGTKEKSAGKSRCCNLIQPLLLLGLTRPNYCCSAGCCQNPLASSLKTPSSRALPSLWTSQSTTPIASGASVFRSQETHLLHGGSLTSLSDSDRHLPSSWESFNSFKLPFEFLSPCPTFCFLAVRSESFLKFPSPSSTGHGHVSSRAQLPVRIHLPRVIGFIEQVNHALRCPALLEERRLLTQTVSRR